MRTYNNLKQGSQEWLDFRKCKVSGSKFSQVISNTKNTRLGLIKEFILDKYANVVDDNYKSPSMTRGTEEERFAVAEYENRFDTKLEVVNLCQHDEFDWVIFSPDRYKNNRKTYVEFKCPKSETMVEYTLDNKLPSVYKPQILLSFIVNEDQEDAELVVYDARFKEFNHQMLVFKVTRAELQAEIYDAMEKLALFKKEWEEVEQHYKNLIF